MEKIKTLFFKIFTKREKETKWNWIFRVGVMLFSLSILLLIFSITCTALGNIDGLKIFSLEPNDISTYSGMASCLVAVVGIFFLFCGKVKKAD